jgi:tetratricopeptide (TPR) repeat protein
VGVLTRLWRRIRRPRGTVHSIELLQRAERFRREGRFEEGASLVREALARDPKSALAQLLDGYFHAALRESEAARASFRAVLALDPEHPRALLGLARIAFEGGDQDAARQMLERALRIYPDFPEALALLDAAQAVGVAPVTETPGGATAARLGQIPRPDGTRECYLLSADGAVVFAHPATATREALAAHFARVASLGAATLSRAGLGPLRRAAVSANPGTTFLQTDGRQMLAVTLPPEVPVAIGQGQTTELWKRYAAEGAA